MKQDLWPEKMEGKRGMYCAECGLVVYSRTFEKRISWECPRCGEHEWYHIFDNWQPKIRYGSVPYKICSECGTVVYGDLENCPVCKNGRLCSAV